MPLRLAFPRLARTGASNVYANELLHDNLRGRPIGRLSPACRLPVISKLDGPPATMWQLVLFDCDNHEDLDALLRGLASVATFREGTAFYFYSQLPGQPAFQFDCELVQGGLITSRKEAYFSFFGHFIDALTSRFGTVEIVKDGSLPESNV